MPFPGPFAGPMNPQFGPQMPPRFPPPIQNQMNFIPPQAPQMNFMQSPQMTQIRFPFPPTPQMPFLPHNIPSPQQNQQQVPPFPAQMMTPPRPEVPQFRLISPAPQQQPQIPRFERPQPQPQAESQESQPMPRPEVRIQLRRIEIPRPISEIFPFLNNMRNDVQKEIEIPRENNNIQVQQVPLAVALSKVGITPDDLRNIQRMAEEKFEQHFRELVDENDNDSSSAESDSNQSDEIESSALATDMPDSEEKISSNQESQATLKSEERPGILALGRSNFGRSLNPIQLPIRPEIQEVERNVNSCKFHSINL